VTAAKVGYTAIMSANHIGGDKRADGTDLDPARRASIILPLYATCTGRLMLMLGLDAEPLPKR
jgi:hypothetical protein